MRLVLGALGALLLCGAAQAQGLRATGPAVPLLADGDALHPVWSPDGGRIAFTRSRYVGLWVVDADGTDARQLSDAPAAGYGFAWSPDGRAIAARTARTDGLRRFHTLVVLDPATGAARPLTDERAQMPALPRWAGPAHVALWGADAPEVLAVDADARAAAPAAPVVLEREGRAALVDPASGVLRPLDPFAGATLLNVTPSPDGARVAFEVMGGTLWVMNADGSGLVDLGPGARPTWSPDGRWVAFMTTADDGHAFTAADLVAARADGSARVALTATPDRLEMNPSWSPDGRAIAFDADGTLYLLLVTE